MQTEEAQKSLDIRDDGVTYVENNITTLSKGSIGDRLNETLAIFAKHFRRFAVMGLVVYVPVNLLSLIGPTSQLTLYMDPRNVSGSEIAFYFLVGFINLIALTIVYSAAVSAVGQHYVSGQLNLKACYSRVWWRILSLLSVMFVLAVGVLIGTAAYILVVPIFVMVWLLVYGSMAPQIVIIERMKPTSALKKSLQLVRGNWWRVFGMQVVLMLILIGLAIVALLPLALMSGPSFAVGAPIVNWFVQYLTSLLANLVTAAIAAIAVTLLYFDLRVRKENYDVKTLTREMGFSLA